MEYEDGFIYFFFLLSNAIHAPKKRVLMTDS